MSYMHPRSLISAFVVRFLDSIISLDSVAEVYTLASFCGCAGRFVSGLVGNSRRHVLSCRGSYSKRRRTKGDHLFYHFNPYKPDVLCLGHRQTVQTQMRRRRTQADLCLCCSRMAKAGFVMMWLKYGQTRKAIKAPSSPNELITSLNRTEAI